MRVPAVVAVALLATTPKAVAGGFFGTADGVTVLDPTHLTPLAAASIFTDAEGYVFPLSGSAELRTGLDLPNGAEVILVCAHTIDSTDQGSVTVSLRGYEYEFTSPASQRDYGFLTTGAAQAPGHGYGCFTPDPPLLIRARDDFDANNTLNYVSYRLEVFLNASTQNRIGGIVIHWRRTISPAPGVQTYDDVAFGSDYHRYVEALAAAGITEGCGGTNFCPDAPLTRAQFALMLARALGLGWPQ